MSRNKNYVVESPTPMVAPPRDFRGVVPSVQQTLGSEVIQHLTFEIQRTLEQFHNPFLTFADLLASAIGQDTQRHDIIYSLELLPAPAPSAPVVPGAPGAPGMSLVQMQTEVSNLFARINFEGLPQHQRETLATFIVNSLMSHVKKEEEEPSEKMKKVQSALNLVASKLIGSSMEQEAALIGAGFDQVQQKAFFNYAHQELQKKHKKSVETLLQVTTIFKPEICGAINMAVSDINLNRQILGLCPVSAIPLICSPSVNAQFARFVAFVHHGNSTVPTMATMVRGIAPYASGGLQTMVKLANPSGHTHFQMLTNMSHRTDALRFFAQLREDPVSGFLVFTPQQYANPPPPSSSSSGRGGLVVRRSSFLTRSMSGSEGREGGGGRGLAYRDARQKIAFLY